MFLLSLVLGRHLQVMTMHRPLCWSFQGCILVGNHILVGQCATELFIGSDFLVTSSIVGLHGWFV